MKNRKLHIHSVIILLIWLVASCGSFLTAINLKNSTEPPVENYKSNSKKLRFIGIAHIAKPELYENVKQEIISAKREGYVLFWEFIDFDDANDTELRKVRKMLGFVPSPEGHAQNAKLDLENGYVAQDNELFLGHINKNDFKVDITPSELVEAYEKNYGEIILTQNDINTPIQESISETLPALNVMYIIKDYRNIHLADVIEKSKHDKIVVLYGALHEKGLYSELRKLNKSWKQA